MSEFEQELKEIAITLASLVASKNRAYGASVFTHGTKGIMIRLEDKVNRVFSLLEGSEDNGESLQDSAADILGYALLLNYAVNNPDKVQEIVMMNACKKANQ